MLRGGREEEEDEDRARRVERGIEIRDDGRSTSWTGHRGGGAAVTSFA